MYLCYNYFNIFSAPLFCLFAIGKGPVYTLLAFILAFGIHPLLDWISNHFFRDFMKRLNGGESKSWTYEIPLFLAVPFQLVLVIVAFINGSSSVTEALCAGALCGLSGGILGIASSHELIHRTKKWQRRYGVAMLYIINYPHFYLEHLHHHIAVGTHNDPDTAFKNESLYRFMPRAIFVGWIKCWKWKDKMTMTITFQILLTLLIFGIGGAKIGLLYMTQGLVTLLLLKWINYVEHYGLVRKLINGKLEPIGDKHSWDSTTAMTNFSLFNLGFHTQHHIKASIKYSDLPKMKEEWNELPAGYSAMMMLALYPSQWKKVMNESLRRLGIS